MTSSIVILTGAGISAESGVATFRDKDGIWSKVDYRDVATPQGFARDPGKVHDFYNVRRRAMADVRPNAAHVALARLERAFCGDFLLVTQNIDDLHERAGSESWSTCTASSPNRCAAPAATGGHGARICPSTSPAQAAGCAA